MKGRKEEWEKEIKRKDRILDIGCWEGMKINRLINKCEAYGMDINTSRFKYAEPEIRKRLFFGDVTEKIPFKKKFDWIFLTEVLEHVENDDSTIRNISGSLKKGGKLILTTPRSTKYLEFWDPAWVRWKFLGGQKHYHYTKEELFKKLNNNSFKIKEYYIMGNLFWVLIRWVNVFFKYGLRLKKQINYPMGEGFCDWIILSEKK